MPTATQTLSFHIDNGGPDSAAADPKALPEVSSFEQLATISGADLEKRTVFKFQTRISNASTAIPETPQDRPSRNSLASVVGDALRSFARSSSEVKRNSINKVITFQRKSQSLSKTQSTQIAPEVEVGQNGNDKDIVNEYQEEQPVLFNEEELQRELESKQKYEVQEEEKEEIVGEQVNVDDTKVDEEKPEVPDTAEVSANDQAEILSNHTNDSDPCHNRHIDRMSDYNSDNTDQQSENDNIEAQRRNLARVSAVSQSSFNGLKTVQTMGFADPVVQLSGASPVEFNEQFPGSFVQENSNLLTTVTEEVQTQTDQQQEEEVKEDPPHPSLAPPLSVLKKNSTKAIKEIEANTTSSKMIIRSFQSRPSINGSTGPIESLLEAQEKIESQKIEIQNQNIQNISLKDRASISSRASSRAARTSLISNISALSAFETLEKDKEVEEEEEGDKDREDQNIKEEDEEKREEDLKENQMQKDEQRVSEATTRASINSEIRSSLISRSSITSNMSTISENNITGYQREPIQIIDDDVEINKRLSAALVPSSIVENGINSSDINGKSQPTRKITLGAFGNNMKRQNSITYLERERSSQGLAGDVILVEKGQVLADSIQNNSNSRRHSLASTAMTSSIVQITSQNLLDRLREEEIIGPGTVTDKGSDVNDTTIDHEKSEAQNYKGPDQSSKETVQDSSINIDRRQSTLSTTSTTTNITTGSRSSVISNRISNISSQASRQSRISDLGKSLDKIARLYELSNEYKQQQKAELSNTVTESQAGQSGDSAESFNLNYNSAENTRKALQELATMGVIKGDAKDLEDDNMEDEDEGILGEDEGENPNPDQVVKVESMSSEIVQDRTSTTSSTGPGQYKSTKEKRRRSRTSGRNSNSTKGLSKKSKDPLDISNLVLLDPTKIFDESFKELNDGQKTPQMVKDSLERKKERKAMKQQQSESSLKRSPYQPNPSPNKKAQTNDRTSTNSNKSKSSTRLSIKPPKAPSKIPLPPVPNPNTDGQYPLMMSSITSQSIRNSIKPLILTGLDKVNNQGGQVQQNKKSLKEQRRKSLEATSKAYECSINNQRNSLNRKSIQNLNSRLSTGTIPDIVPSPKDETSNSMPINLIGSQIASMTMKKSQSEENLLNSENPNLNNQTQTEQPQQSGHQAPTSLTLNLHNIDNNITSAAFQILSDSAFVEGSTPGISTARDSNLGVIFSARSREVSREIQQSQSQNNSQQSQQQQLSQNSNSQQSLQFNNQLQNSDSSKRLSLSQEEKDDEDVENFINNLDDAVTNSNGTELVNSLNNDTSTSKLESGTLIDDPSSTTVSKNLFQRVNSGNLSVNSSLMSQERRRSWIGNTLQKGGSTIRRSFSGMSLPRLSLGGSSSSAASSSELVNHDDITNPPAFSRRPSLLSRLNSFSKKMIGSYVNPNLVLPSEDSQSKDNESEEDIASNKHNVNSDLASNPSSAALEAREANSVMIELSYESTKAQLVDGDKDVEKDVDNVNDLNSDIEDSNTLKMLPGKVE